jgi:hypothetical protein
MYSQESYTTRTRKDAIKKEASYLPSFHSENPWGYLVIEARYCVQLDTRRS